MLAKGFRERGHDTIVTRFAHGYEYFPHLLKIVPAPAKTDVIPCNSGNAFAFKRANTPLNGVEHLFVLDPAFAPYKPYALTLAHEIIIRRFLQASHRTASAFVAVSHYTAKACGEIMQGNAPRVILNGIDTNFFRPLDQVPLESPRLPMRLLYVGNLSKRKRTDLLPAILERSGPGYELSYTSGLRTQNLLGDVPNCIPLGRLNHEEVRAAYRNADPMVFPSRLEGLSLTIMEAMASGLPVIASNCSSMPELIEDGVSGVLVPQDDVDGFAEAIAGLSADRGRLNSMSINARKRAKSSFGLDRMIDEYLALFDEVGSVRPKAYHKQQEQDQPAF